MGNKNLIYAPIQLPKFLLKFAAKKAYEYGGVI
jgi:hypothetical protein